MEMICYFQTEYATEYYSKQELFDDPEILKLALGPTENIMRPNVLNIFDTALKHQQYTDDAKFIAMKSTHPKCMWLLLGKQK